jgi:hypothetical protein
VNPLNLLAELVIGLAEAACELAIRELEASDDFAARFVAGAARADMRLRLAPAFRDEILSIRHITSLITAMNVLRLVQ